MKILIVFFGDDYHGGTTYSTFTIADELVKRGHEVHAYVHVTPSGVLARDLQERGIIIHDGRSTNVTHPVQENRLLYKPVRVLLEQLRRYIFLPAAERKVASLISTEKIDLVVISSGATTTGASASAMTGIPYVWHLREFMQEDHGLEYYSWADAPGFMQQASCLICVSKAVERKIKQICPRGLTAVVYNGFDQEVFNSEELTKPKTNSMIRLMTTGGLRHSKGTFLVLDALAKLDSGIRYQLDIYGEEGRGQGESLRDLKLYCHKLSLDEKVRYWGVVNNMADLYRSHDINVVASRAEAFGRTTAEAMLCGCAVVGSNSGGTPELLSQGRGYLFESDDVGSLAAVLSEAIQAGDDRQMRIEAAYTFARDAFSIESYLNAVERIYRTAAA